MENKETLLLVNFPLLLRARKRQTYVERRSKKNAKKHLCKTNTYAYTHTNGEKDMPMFTLHTPDKWLNAETKKN